MSTDAIDAAHAAATRREALLQAAIGVFMRYGYKKTSMDDLARAAGMSRQGLYLHFPAKDDLFREAVTLLSQRSLAVMRAALAQPDAAIEDRLVGAFVALKSHGDGSETSNEHMAELFIAAKQLVGPVVDELEQALMAELTRALQAGGISAQWKPAGITAKELAQHLNAASHGIKQVATNLSDYQARMRIAVRLVCRGVPSPTLSKSAAQAATKTTTRTARKPRGIA